MNNKRYQHILFDLDGTLTDPMIGITSSVKYALSYFNIEVEDLRSLCPFIGPPLKTSFKDFYQFTDEQADVAIAKYREYFSKQGIFENTLYQGIDELLRLLTENRSEKANVIQYVLDSTDIKTRSDVVMIGDRKYDIKGAKANNIDSIGVLYGYGDEEELANAGANKIVTDIKELSSFLLTGNIPI